MMARPGRVRLRYARPVARPAQAWERLPNGAWVARVGMRHRLVVRRDGLFQAWPNAMAACVNRRTDGHATPLANSVGEVKADLYRLTDAMPHPDP